MRIRDAICAHTMRYSRWESSENWIWKTIDGLDYLDCFEKQQPEAMFTQTGKLGMLFGAFFVGFFLVGGVCLEVIKHYHMANIEIKMSILFGYYLKDSPLPVQDVMCFSFFSFLINNYFLVLDYIIL